MESKTKKVSINHNQIELYLSVRAFLSKDRTQLNITMGNLLEKIKTMANLTISDLKKDVESDIVFAEALSLLKTTTSDLNSKIEALRLIVTELLENQKIEEADDTYSQYNNRLMEVIQELDESIQRIHDELYQNNVELTDNLNMYRKLYSNLEKEWTTQKNNLLDTLKELKTKLDIHFEQWMDKSKHYVEEELSRLKSFSDKVRKRITTLSQLIENKTFLTADNILKKIEEDITNEFKYQKQKIKEIPPDLIPLHKKSIEKWEKELKNNEIAIQILISPFKKEIVEKAIDEYISILEKFSADLHEKLEDISEEITEKKFTKAEKDLETIEEQIQKILEEHKKNIAEKSEIQQNNLNEALLKWRGLIDGIENDFSPQILDIKTKIRYQHQDQLLEKVELFIKQNIEALNKVLDDFKTEAMTQLRIHFNSANPDIIKSISNQKKEVFHEFDNKDKHIQLVFKRYENYPLDDEKENWKDQIKLMQNRLNDIHTTIFGLLEEKDQINYILNKYYEMAQPAYGYKVPIKVLAENLDFSADKLENVFVELISYKFVSGEIDPITKVIVLAPRVTPEEKPRRVTQLRCMVCNLIINPSEEEIIYCPYCNSPAHRSHLIEWIKIKGICPRCKKEIKMI